jgi:tetratricopeptide (TPR) repeat protein
MTTVLRSTQIAGQMTVSASTQIPKTSDPTVFQRQCKVLFEHVLKDPGVKEFGSSGQAQKGIDLLGRRKNVGLDHWVGIQCKLKIKAAKLERKTVREEAEAALQFKPLLKELIIVTTAPDHVELDEEAATISDEQAKLGRDFHVQVWGWGTLETHILQYEEVVRAFFPDAFPHFQRLFEGQERLAAQVESGNDAVLAELRQLNAHVKGASLSASINTEEGSRLDTILDRQIDGYRDLLNAGHSATAASMLQTMWELLPPDAAGRIRYRVKANIAASKLRLGDREEAGRLYLEAVELAPNEPKALAFKVLGLVLLDRPREAYELGVDAIARSEEKVALVCHTLLAANQLLGVTDPLSIIPDGIAGDPNVLVAKIALLRTRHDPTWRDVAGAAFADHPQNKDLARFAAEAIIDEGCSWADQTFRSLLPGELAVRVNDAASILAVQFTEMLALPDVRSNFDISLCLNLATAYRLLRQFDRAREIIGKGLDFAPDDKEVRDGWAKVVLESGDAVEVGDVIQNLLDARDYTVAKFASLANQSKWKELATLDSAVNIDELPISDQAFVCSLLLLARSRTDDSLDPRDCADALLAKYPDEPIVPIILHAIAKARRDGEWATSLYKRAEEQREKLNLPARLMLARVAEQEDDPQVVTELLHDHIPLDRDSEELRLLARAFVNAPPRQAAVDFVSALPDKLSKDEFFSRVIGAIEFNRGALAKAEAAFRSAVEARPTSLEAHLGLVNTYLRLDRYNDVADHLKSLDLNALEGPAHLKVGLAQLLARSGRSEEALAYAYEIALKNRSDAKVNLFYIGLLLPAPTALPIPEVGEVVGVDCAVDIERQDGRRLRVTVVEGRDDPSIDHYGSEHRLARMLLGARMGDTIVLEQGLGTPQTWKVLGFKHKYLALLHDIIEGFPTRFPDARGFYVVETPEDDVGPLLEQIKADSLRTEEHLGRYATEGFPLCMIGALLGQTSIATAGQLASSGMVIKTCIGTQAERMAALDAIANARKSGVVLDAYTAWCAQTLGLLGAIKSLFPRVVVPQSVIDEMRTFRDRYDNRGDEPMMTIGYRDGKFLRQEISPEELRRSADTIGSAIESISKECELLPAAAPGSPSQLESLFLEIAGAGSLDTIHLAASEGLLLLSDDLHFRNLASQLYPVNGVWLQVVLMAALEEGTLDFAAYTDAVSALASQRHEYVSVSAALLAHIAVRDDDGALPQLAAALEFIGTPTAEIRSHFAVAWDFMKHIWDSRTLSDLTKAKACGMTLNRLMPMYSAHGDFAEILRQMIRHSGQRPRLQRYMVDWARGHFISLERTATAIPMQPETAVPKEGGLKKYGKSRRRHRGRHGR